MSTRLLDHLRSRIGELRHEPTEKRIRGKLGERTVIDTTRALLVWEPGNVLPRYAIPIADIDGEITDGGDGPQHSADGEPVRIAGTATGLRPADPALDGYVIVDFDSIDAWYEEDEPNLGHPRDPFHRIDIVHSSRHVTVELDGTVVADSRSPYLLFETQLPARYYLAVEDVRTELLSPTDTTTFCAYKGQASYWSFEGNEDIVWTYREPLREAAEITGRLCFFNEHADIRVDGELVERPDTPWSRR